MNSVDLKEVRRVVTSPEYWLASSLVTSSFSYGKNKITLNSLDEIEHHLCNAHMQILKFYLSNAIKSYVGIQLTSLHTSSGFELPIKTQHPRYMSQFLIQ